MSNDESTDRPTGWLQRQLENASENVKSWPQWMRDAATPPEAGQPAQERWRLVTRDSSPCLRRGGITTWPLSDLQAQAVSEILAERDALEARAEADRHLRSLLAVIHRDGGHYAVEHGLDKATKDAQDMVLADRQRIAELEGERDRYKAAMESWYEQHRTMSRRAEAAEAERDALSDDAKQLDLLLVEAREALQRVKAERDALRARAGLADRAKPMVVSSLRRDGARERWITDYNALTTPARRRHEAWCLTQQKDDGANRECTCGLTTPAASQEEGT